MISCAPKVCRFCRERKKACDKQLPRCGNCQKRGTTCTYEYDLPTCRGSMLLDATVSMDRSIESQVQDLILSLGHTSRSVTERYFSDFHPWLPVISLQLAEDPEPPHTADTSVLILAMCLLTQSPPMDDLYLSLRMLLTRTQAAIPNSLPLIQTHLITAAYEYARGWLSIAYVTMGTCARMARALRVHRCEVQSAPAEQRWHAYKSLERWNLWWGIMIMESAVQSEMPDKDLTPAIEFPSPECYLPAGLRSIKVAGADIVPSVKLSNLQDARIDGFGRLAQAVYLLHRVIQLLDHVENKRAGLKDLETLDGEAQTFLKVLLEGDATSNPTCSSAMTVTIRCPDINVVRALFLLHGKKLALPIHMVPDQSRQNSWAALITATKIVSDAAFDHTHGGSTQPHPHYSLPLCCACNLYDAKVYISTLHYAGDAEERTRTLASLEALEQQFSSRWRPADSLYGFERAPSISSIS